MPCFKGLAVSIHTPDGPLPEYSVQRQSRLARINSYIPVPPAKIPEGSKTNKAEQSTFAISITLLTPGQTVPYSTPKASPDDPSPKPKLVGGLPGYAGDKAKNAGAIGPYIPLTTSPNETIAAYIYFDGRAKEEVATLLRRGEETWVNSRWVGIPESEGGGLAEREFLFREVGLERWLNGLDLEGKDAAAKIERRRQKMEKRRRKRNETKGSDDENGIMEISPRKPAEARGVLRYGADERAPLEKLSDDEDLLSSDSDSDDDDDPIPETAGQIKVALFRVLASGEIKRGEYSPQFDAHDDDSDSLNGHENGHANGSGGDDGDADHTTSFAKPKSLDPKSISTQTVTGIDPTDKPYAVFTFMYRGERQLQKMGIIRPPKTQEKTPVASKRRSVQTDFSNLGPLKPGGTVGFAGFRDSAAKSPKFDAGKGTKKSKDSDMDSDEDDDELATGRIEQIDGKDDNGQLLSPEDAQRQGELAEGVRKIKLKRQHSAEPLSAQTGTPEPRKNSKSNTPTAGSTPPAISSTPPPPLPGSTKLETSFDFGQNTDDFTVGSPLKKQRASLPGLDDDMTRRRLGLGFGATLGDILGSGNMSSSGGNGGPTNKEAGNLGAAFSTSRNPMKVEEEEEL